MNLLNAVEKFIFPELNEANDLNDTLNNESFLNNNIITPYDSDEFSSLDKELKAIKAIQDSWKDDLSAENDRLIHANFFPRDIREKIERLSRRSPEVAQSYAVYGRLWELKNLYSDTHYVFTHGQASHVSILNKIYKESLVSFNPQLAHPLKIPFRSSSSSICNDNAENFINKYLIDILKTDKLSWFDHDHRDELLSVDSQFWNDQDSESADYFFTNSGSVNINKPEELRDLLIKHFLKYLSSEKACQLLADKAVELAKKRKEETTAGVMYAICIPKILIQNDQTNFTYPSYRLGVPCNCHPLKDRIKLLDHMQNGHRIVCQPQRMCRYNLPMQYRILADNLNTAKGVRIFSVDTLTKAKQNEYDQEVKDLVKELKLCTLLLDLYKKIKTDFFAMGKLHAFESQYPQFIAEYGTILAES